MEWGWGKKIIDDLLARKTCAEDALGKDRLEAGDSLKSPGQQVALRAEEKVTEPNSGR